MRKVSIPKLKDSCLVSQLLSLYEVFKNSSLEEAEETLIFDFSNLAWVFPFLVLPLSAYIQDTGSDFSINSNKEIESYLKIIGFPKGIDSVSSFREKIQHEKSYIPISVLKKEAGESRERLQSMFEEMICKSLGAISGIKNAIYYPIGELVANIFEHSKQTKGFIFGQLYPKKNYLDICIVDRGRGLSLAYKQEKDLNLSDEDAIVEAMKGNSTKSDKERGYGIRTSKRVICEALGGEFILVSGSAALISDKKSQRLVSLTGFYWKGVIIAYRIPVPKNSIDISEYLE